MSFASADLTSVNELDCAQVVTLRQQSRHVGPGESVRPAGTLLNASMILAQRNDKRRT